MQCNINALSVREYREIKFKYQTLRKLSDANKYELINFSSLGLIFDCGV